MEQDQLPVCPPGQPGSDRASFERVWRRVMPEDRSDCPFRLYEGAAAAPPPPRLPRYPTIDAAPEVTLPLYQPSEGRGLAEEAAGVGGRPPSPGLACVVPTGRQTPQLPGNQVPCLGAASAMYGALLQEFIAHELSDWRTYQLLSKRAVGAAARTLGAIGGEERLHAKRISTAYFLISGVRFWPERVPGVTDGTYLGALRTRFAEEQKGAAAYHAAAQQTTDACLRELYLELAGGELSHMWLIRGLLEQM